MHNYPYMPSNNTLRPQIEKSFTLDIHFYNDSYRLDSNESKVEMEYITISHLIGKHIFSS